MKDFLSATLTPAWYRLRDMLPRRRDRFMLMVFCILVVLGVSVNLTFLHAQTLTDIGNGLIQAVSWVVLTIGQIFIQLTVFALKFFILVAGYSNYIGSPMVILGWNMMRDIANMFFIVVLLVIAIGTILGVGDYEWKHLLGKLLVAALLVNFSNLILQLIIDVSQVFTITFLNAVAGTAGGNLISIFNLDKVYQIAYGNASPQGFQVELLGGAIMALVFAAIAMITIGEYLIVMLFRVVILWTLMIFSPLAFLFSILPQTHSYAEEFWHEFTHHVIAAPIMVFFLWLAFATFGSPALGDPCSQLEQDNRVKTTSVCNAEDAEQKKLGASTSEAGSWANMANFAVAIAFLWIGIERVQSLGIRGGSLVGGGIAFGKRVATIASGYAVGKWAVGKGEELGAGLVGGIANRIPLVGGAALKEYGAAISSTFKRKGIGGVLGGAAQILSGGTVGKGWQFGGIEGKIKRSEQAKSMEGKAGPLGWIAARIWEPAARAEKRAEDWTEAAERMHKVEEESYTTSSTRAGQAKVDATVELKATEEMAHKKGEEKTEGRFAMARGLEHAFNGAIKHEIDAMAASGTAVPAEGTKERKELEKKLGDKKMKDKDFMKHVKDHYLDSLNPKDRKDAEKVLARDGIYDKIKLARFVEKQEGAAAGAGAASEEKHKERARIEELAMAKQKDELLMKNNKTPRYVESVTAKHTKEDMDLVGSSSYDRSMAKLIHVRDRLREPTLGRQEEESLRKELADLQSFNQSRGSVFAVGGTEKAIAGLKGEPLEDFDADDISGQQAKELSALLQRKVGKDKASIEKALNELKDQMGDQYTAFMRTYIDALNNSANQGAINKAGLFHEEYNGTDGTSTFIAVDPKDTTTPLGIKAGKWSKDKRDYAVSKSKFNTIEGFSGSLDQKWDAGKKQYNYVANSKAAKERVAQMFRGVTSNVASSIDQETINTFNGMFASMEKKEIEALLKEMEARSSNIQGLKTLLRRTDLRTNGDFEVAGEKIKK